MAWVGLDRISKLSKKYERESSSVKTCQEVAHRIRLEIEEKGYYEKLQSYTQVFHGDALDASLLTLPLVGFCEATSPRMKPTLNSIARSLERNKLIYRYMTADVVRGDESTFGISTFWYIETLARSGNRKSVV